MKALLKYLNVRYLIETAIAVVVGCISSFLVGVVLHLFWYVFKAGWNVWPW